MQARQQGLQSWQTKGKKKGESVKVVMVEGCGPWRKTAEDRRYKRRDPKGEGGGRDTRGVEEGVNQEGKSIMPIKKARSYVNQKENRAMQSTSGRGRPVYLGKAVSRVVLAE